MQRVVCRVGMGARSLSGAMLVVALGLASCSGDPSGEQGQRTQSAPAALPVQLEEGSLSVELSSLDLATGQILYTIENNSSQSVRLLRRDTALRGVTANLFDVRLGAEPADYVGPHVYWGDPRPQDFVDVPAGGVVEGLVDLPALYDMRRAGEYTVQARPHSVAILAAGADVAMGVVVPASASTVVRLADAHRSQPTTPKLLNSTQDCSATDLANMTAAEAEALRLTQRAILHLQNMPFVGDTGGAYERWFGDPERDFNDVRTVESILSRVRNINSGLPVTQFRCRTDGVVLFVDAAGNSVGCGPTVDLPASAATNGALGRTVHVCPSFLSESARRMASLMVHELSHHHGTSDVVTGFAAALNLAITDPDSTTLSAENYEQYVLEF